MTSIQAHVYGLCKMAASHDWEHYISTLQEDDPKHIVDKALWYAKLGRYIRTGEYHA